MSPRSTQQPKSGRNSTRSGSRGKSTNSRSRNTKPARPQIQAELIDPEAGVWEATATIDNGDFGKRTVRFESGLLARQADGAVTAYLDDDTMLLSTTTASRNPREGIDFFPLTVDVEERMYAAGRIPGSFFRREGRPGTEAILAARLIDRPLRPTFVKGLRNEVQVIITVLSIDPAEMYDVLAINAASASTQLSGLPVSSAVGGVRMALVVDEDHPQGQWVAFPTREQIEASVFELVVAGRVTEPVKGGRGRRPKTDETNVAVMMVEAGATANAVERIADGAPAPTEAVVAEGIEAAKPFIATLCDAQDALSRAIGSEAREFELFPPYDQDVYTSVEAETAEALGEIMSIADKQERDEALAENMQATVDELAEEFPERESEIRAAHNEVTKQLVRQRILEEGFRIDGRDSTTIRDLGIVVQLVPRAHGSALFERGETQILGVTTLDTLKMEQQIDSLGPESSKRYIHHYNFPPFSTGETGRVGSPKRREIGHGALAERALVPVIPSRDEFPYAIRQVSEAMGSNGSTSMGSVCASTLSLYNAGVPLRAPVAGIAMGLVTGKVGNKDKYVTLTDILGAEDAFGDMDFKVAGTESFVTALQLDTKLDGIPSDVLAEALGQARTARLEILQLMEDAIDSPDDMSEFAPRITTISIPSSKIGEVIGPKGKTINQITEETGADISIEEDGTVFISATGGQAAAAAEEKINAIANPQLPKIGDRFLGTVVKTTAFGAFVSLVPGRDGLIHISNLGGDRRIERVEDEVSVGDKIEVEIADVDNRGKISLVPVDEN
ncbi:polyribonucleotide nucleotidyltransferase [Corynebacterium auriscanis]|uniref:polyribonucleotide nucleotidyltransferase n=1 Tax=Corynebacterium auriscanis TaxID=99807 RepID=UPI0024AE0F89|nr:polyribonucleotide nucleotidyltransferase [Corynebacterium auriscanis]